MRLGAGIESEENSRRQTRPHIEFPPFLVIAEQAAVICRSVEMAVVSNKLVDFAALAACPQLRTPCTNQTSRSPFSAATSSSIDNTTSLRRQR